MKSKSLTQIVRFAGAALLITVLSCAHTNSKPISLEDMKLENIISAYTVGMKHLDPFDAAYFNVEEDLDKFGDYASPQFFEREKNLFTTALSDLKTVNPEALSQPEHVTYLLFKENMEVGVEKYKFPAHYLEFNQMGNRLHAYMDDSSPDLTTFPFDSVKHYEKFLKRSEGFGTYVDNEIAHLREGIKNKIVLGCEVAKLTPNNYQEALEPAIDKNPFWRPVTVMPKSFSETDKARLTAGFRTMIHDRILPGYQKFDHFYRTEYIPQCRHSFGIKDFANSATWYTHAIRSSTSLAMDAKTIHETGLKEVARISGEIEKIKNQLGFKGSLAAFLKSISTDPKYYFTSPKDMFDAFTKVGEEVKKRLPQYFILIPKSEMKIVESSNSEDAAGSYYDPTEMVPHGRFVVNTKNLHSVGKYGITTLMMHEAIPGHHFQLALQFEMKNELSEYRRKLFSSNAFVEGWALYTEYLGNEMGMYADPLQRLGNLNDEMLRAVRLVVDTGIHAYGWSQQKTIAYMTKYLASDRKDIEVEANRYSVWPGQALGYKIGQLKIIRLRKWAEKELGAKFDIREFHKVVIGSGTLSLNVLEMQVRDWIEKTKGLPPGALIKRG